MLVSRDGRMAGSVSGGCLEAAVVLEAQATLAGEAPPRILHYGISDDLGWEVGLSCGGTVDIFVETIMGDVSDPVFRELQCEVEAERPIVLLTVLHGAYAGSRAALATENRLVGTLGSTSMDAEAPESAAARLASGLAGIDEIDGVQVFVDPIVPAPQLAVIGAVDIAIPLTSMARAAEFRVTVIDPRRAFNTEDRIPNAHRRMILWPDAAIPELGLGRRDAAVCLAHDPKFEDPALMGLLRTDVGYVGAIGSRSTHTKRVARLLEGGLCDADIARIHSPVGLDLGAASPAEIALAVLGEIVAVRRGRSGGSLSAKQAATVA